MTFYEKRMKKRYISKADAALGAILLYAFCGVTLMILASVAYFACFPIYGRAMPTRMVIGLAPFFLFLVTVLIVRRCLFRGSIRTWKYALLLAATGLALWFSIGWFRDPMHDIGMFFGSHGRWGCYCPGYIIRDRTAPWLLFGPVFVAVIAHRGWNRRQSQHIGVHGRLTSSPA